MVALLTLLTVLAAPHASSRLPSPGLAIEQVEPALETSETPADWHLAAMSQLAYGAAAGTARYVNSLLLVGEAGKQWGPWGFYAMLQARLDKFDGARPEGYLYFQQAYAQWHAADATLKLGKIYARFGHGWAYGFYGPLVADYDLKMQPELGISIEGELRPASRWGVAYAGQYFVADGRAIDAKLNEPLSLTGPRRRNITVLRVAPTFHQDSSHSLALGASFESFTSSTTQSLVQRGAIDVDVAAGAISLFAEAGAQNGNDVTASGTPVSNFLYVWSQAQWRSGIWCARYQFNVLWHRVNKGAAQYLHQPGIEVAVAPNIDVLGELALWNSTSPTDPVGERALYAIVRMHIERDESSQ